ncbi:MAG: DUF981 family protein [Beutenbergiaceae bacterium]
MTLTWPLAPQYAADNISFGEPTLIVGALGLGLAFYFWKQAEAIVSADDADALIAGDIRSLRFLLYAIGLGLISIGAAGPVWGLYTAPPEEPLVGIFAAVGFPWVFSWVFFIVYAATGVLALMTPSVLNQMPTPGAVASKRDLFVAKGIVSMGGVYLAMAAGVYFTHIGMVLNTTG